MAIGNLGRKEAMLRREMNLRQTVVTLFVMNWWIIDVCLGPLGTATPLPKVTDYVAQLHCVPDCRLDRTYLVV